MTELQHKAEHLPSIDQKSCLNVDDRLNSYSLINEKFNEMSFLVGLFDWKTGIARDLPPLWCALGGTGTGKSTIFNSLLSSSVSHVGVRRPCTMTAIILAHEKYRDALLAAPVIFDGETKQANLTVDSKAELLNAVLIDTPDFDSIATQNRLVAKRFLALGDIVVFVTSQEKYGDLACRRMLEDAHAWGKKIILILNKSTSDTPLGEYTDFIRSLRIQDELVVIPRLPGTPTRIEHLDQNPQIRELLCCPPTSPTAIMIKSHEIENLKTKTLEAINDLQVSLHKQTDRVSKINLEIETIAAALSDDLNKKLDAIVSQDVERKMKARLQALLRKYDILFVPRLMLRNAVHSLVGYVSGLFFSVDKSRDRIGDDRHIRFEDFEGVESVAPLGPLDASVTNLNLKVAEILASNADYGDLRLIAAKEVQRFDYKATKSMYEAAFPGLENLLETEFEKIRQGLTRFDEVKLYGSYTLWALLLITFEIVIGGGLTLLDLLLNSVIVPFIPKWLLDLKILDILRSIARRVDAEHRACLGNILFKQAELYTECFSGLVPDQSALSEIENLRLRILQTQTTS